MPLQNVTKPVDLPASSFPAVWMENANTAHIKSNRNNASTGIQTVHMNRRPTSADEAFARFQTSYGSASTLASDSSNSSPTNTSYTMGSSSATDPSPNSSPESPDSKSKHYRFLSAPGSVKPPPELFMDSSHFTNASRKPRNLKNLAVNTSSHSLFGRAVSTASLPMAAASPEDKASSMPTTAMSATTMPAFATFVRPPPPPKRKLTTLGLTIMTPLTNSVNTSTSRSIIPPSPISKHPVTLRHFQSSPSLSVQSPSDASLGHAQLRSPPKLAEMPAESDEIEEEPNFDVPQSREEKVQAYPNGPVCIYDHSVYLYLEPTAEQASNYDVILNVASEVANPFHPLAENTIPLPPNEGLAHPVRIEPTSGSDLTSFPQGSTLLSDPKDASIPARLSDVTQSSTSSAAEVPPAQSSSSTRHDRPEYIHIPWEHNTDIVPDLYRLVKLIDDRVSQQKRVLIHCQCGVSRSASLVVAYGLYKNPNVSVQAAYDVVKRRSKWIGPNMNLIMQLQEFRNGLLRGAAGSSTRHKDNGFTRRLPHSAASTPISGPSADSKFSFNKQNPSSEPLSAPILPDLSSPAQRASTGDLDKIGPGPLSARSRYLWLLDQRNSWTPGQGSAEFNVPSITASPTTVVVKGDGHSLMRSNLEREKVHAIPSHIKTKPHSGPFEPSVSTYPHAYGSFLVDKNDSTSNGLSENAEKGRDRSPSNQLMSPRSAEFAMTSLTQSISDDSFGLTSPRSLEFNLHPTSRAAQSALTSFQTQAKEAYIQRQQSPPRHNGSLSSALHQRASPARNFSRPAPIMVQERAPARNPPALLFVETEPESGLEALKSPRTLEFATASLDATLPALGPGPPPFTARGNQQRESDENEFGLNDLKSPRTAEFATAPLRELSPAFVESAPRTKSAEKVDPRSPPLKGGSPILRNIFDVL